MQLLDPESDISLVDGRWLVTGPHPWLRFRPFGKAAHSGWLEIVYRSGLFDDPVRPLLRLWRSDCSFEDVYLPAPVLGRGIWIGWLPNGVTALSICPAATTGPVSFAIERCSAPSFPRLLVRAAGGRGVHVAAAAALFGLGKTVRARKRLARAILERSVSKYGEWAALRRRDLDPAFDRQRGTTGSRLSFALAAEAEGASPFAIEQTLKSLLAQEHTDWRLDVRTEAASRAALEVLARNANRDNRIQCGADPIATQAAITSDVRFGDILKPYALSLVADRFGVDIHAQSIRADIEFSVAHGVVKPGFAPARSVLADADIPEVGLTFRRYPSSASAAATLPGLRRVIARRLLPTDPPPPCPVLTGPRPSVSIVVPTRDRLALLRECLDGLLQRTNYSNMDITVVDNDSEKPDTLAYFESLDPRRVALRRFQGAFNFSAICNYAASQTSGEVLVFLNNDVVIQDPDWLSHLVNWASRDRVGAVGPLLFYPDGRLQHAGVIIGHGGAAGHIYAQRPASERGLWGELAVPHEVSGVTGACLAVGRAKFDAVGGFDAKHFAVTLNDIDLCLRLKAAGWATILTPFSKMIHKESATRGRSGVYPSEVAAFRRRWSGVIRDDPFFHPAYSLHSLMPVLG